MDINIRIKVPAIIERILTALLIAYRRREYGYGFMRIRLIGGNSIGTKPAAAQYAIVDPEDYQKLGRCDWLLKESRNTCYAWRMQFEEGGKLKIIYMHREIMQAAAGTIIDHENRNGLDNRKANLKFSDHRQNALNCAKKARPGMSKYKGVCRDKKRGKWRAYIHNDLKPIKSQP
jgi:hypothetical protein